MTTSTVTEIRRNGKLVGERVELARYTITAGKRIVWGQRIDGVVRISDCPADARGRAVLIERGLERDGLAALRALVIDYVGQADLHDEIPALRTLVRELD